MTDAYRAYVAALCEADDATARAEQAERQQSERARAADAAAAQDAEKQRRRVAATLGRREAVAERLRALPADLPAPRDRRPAASSDPLALAEQLLSRAEQAAAGCDDELAAIKRQRVRLHEAQAGAEGSRRAEREREAARLREARLDAARGDRVLGLTSALIGILVLATGMVVSAVVACAVGVVLAGLFALLARARPSSLPARIQRRRTGITTDDPTWTFPPPTPIVGAIFASAVVIAGVATLVGGALSGETAGIALGGVLAALGAGAALKLGQSSTEGQPI
jgi:hypothetical protein